MHACIRGFSALLDSYSYGYSMACRTGNMVQSCTVLVGILHTVCTSYRYGIAIHVPYMSQGTYSVVLFWMSSISRVFGNRGQGASQILPVRTSQDASILSWILLILMALSMIGGATAAFNPIQAIAIRIATIDIVGLDKRATPSPSTSPLRSINTALSRAAQRIVMSAEVGVMGDAPIIGDRNFDPLSLRKRFPDSFIAFREAEIKHGRLAMLAAVAWPLQEILHPCVPQH